MVAFGVAWAVNQGHLFLDRFQRKNKPATGLDQWQFLIIFERPEG